MKDNGFTDIPGYKGEYQISRDGIVKALPRVWVTGRGTTRYYNGGILNPIIKRCGYPHFNLRHNGKQIQWSLHRLLAITFIPNPEQKRTVNHIDGNKLNNTLENLEWATYAENSQHALDTGLRVNPSGFDNGAAVPVKVLKSGSLIGCYGSLRDAGKVLNIPYDSLVKISGGKSIPKWGIEIEKVSRAEYCKLY